MEEKRETRLLLATEESNWEPKVLTLKAYPVYINEAGELRNFTSGSFDYEALADLAIRAQADSSGAAYGWSVEYAQPYTVDLRIAEVMVKLLRKINKGLAKLDEKYGPAESYGHYVVRVADVLSVGGEAGTGIGQFGWKVSGGGSLMANNEYRWTGAAGFIAHVNHVVAEFTKEQTREAVH